MIVYLNWGLLVIGTDSRRDDTGALDVNQDILSTQLYAIEFNYFLKFQGFCILRLVGVV